MPGRGLSAGSRMDRLRSHQCVGRHGPSGPVAVVRDPRQASPIAGTFSGSPSAFLSMDVAVFVSSRPAPPWPGPEISIMPLETRSETGQVEIEEGTIPRLKPMRRGPASATGKRRKLRERHWSKLRSGKPFCQAQWRPRQIHHDRAAPRRGGRGERLWRASQPLDLEATTQPNPSGDPPATQPAI